MTGATGDLADWNVVAAKAGQHVRRLALRHLLAESKLAEAITAPAEDFGELFRWHVLVVFESQLNLPCYVFGPEGRHLVRVALGGCVVVISRPNVLKLNHLRVGAVNS